MEHVRQPHDQSRPHRRVGDRDAGQKSSKPVRPSDFLEITYFAYLVPNNHHSLEDDYSCSK